jgi:hypothetical protein
MTEVDKVVATAHAWAADVLEDALLDVVEDAEVLEALQGLIADLRA